MSNLRPSALGFAILLLPHFPPQFVGHLPGTKTFSVSCLGPCCSPHLLKPTPFHVTPLLDPRRGANY